MSRPSQTHTIANHSSARSADAERESWGRGRQRAISPATCNRCREADYETSP